MSRLAPEPPKPPPVADERLDNLAHAIGLREWHTDHSIKINFELYFAINRDRLLAEAAKPD